MGIDLCSGEQRDVGEELRMACRHRSFAESRVRVAVTESAFDQHAEDVFDEFEFVGGSHRRIAKIQRFQVRAVCGRTSHTRRT
ncbi:MAG: hypothetical protein ABL959_00485 [Pyrinomonadaceae bacterium]